MHLDYFTQKVKHTVLSKMRSNSIRFNYITERAVDRTDFDSPPRFKRSLQRIDLFAIIGQAVVLILYYSILILFYFIVFYFIALFVCMLAYVLLCFLLCYLNASFELSCYRATVSAVSVCVSGPADI